LRRPGQVITEENEAVDGYDDHQHDDHQYGEHAHRRIEHLEEPSRLGGALLLLLFKSNKIAERSKPRCRKPLTTNIRERLFYVVA
jgi:hypothetical protein